MEKYLKNKESLEIFNEKEWYKEKIIEMAKQIKNQRFLKAIYISMSDYLKENEPE